MSLDPEILKQLIETFSIELAEQLQVITDGLLQLEKTKDPKLIESIFRAAHNIKGSARSIGIADVGELAHHLETLFNKIQKQEIAVNAKIINSCLEATDKIKIAMDAYLNQKPLNFDLASFTSQIDQLNGETVKEEEKKTEQREDAQPTVAPLGMQADTIRIAINNIDRISALLEEIQVHKISLEEHYPTLLQMGQNLNLLTTCQSLQIEGIEETKLAQNDLKAELLLSVSQMAKNFLQQMNGFSTLFNSLQDEFRQLRLVPAENLLHTLPRFVRDTAQALNKEIEFKITGAEVKLDKMILETLKDPIIHIIRNSIDHGIESIEERTAKQKNTQGHIQLNIIEEGGQVTIQIKDDGQGLDPQHILEVAKHKKLITPEQAEKLSLQEILNLIFLPSFSTKEMITDLSGRGVGLDVVKTNLDKINGHISVSSEVNVGTCFSLSFPLTLTSERGLMIRTNGFDFVIPTQYIEKILYLKADEILNVETTQAVLLNKNPVILRNLATLLNLETNNYTPSDKLSIIVIKKSDQRIACLVDEIVGEKELVIKPLQMPAAKNKFISGGSVFGNNQVIFVLNISGLINQALQITPTQSVSIQNVKETEIERPRILVVDDSITTRTLEKNILESKNYNVTVAVNGKEAWDLIQKNPFSLIITDVNMPIMDGFTLTEHIKQSEKTKNIPVIIVTSLGSNDEKKRGIEVGANAYIVKNEFESSTLLDVVKQLV